MDDEQFRSVWIVVAMLFAPPLLYVTAYVCMLEEGAARILIGAYSVEMRPVYRIRNRTIVAFFRPIHTLDRRLCPERWKDPSPPGSPYSNDGYTRNPNVTYPQSNTDGMHLSVVGDAFVIAEDSDGKRYYIKSCDLAIDEYQVLCARINNEPVELLLGASIPREAESFRILPDGHVSVSNSSDDGEVWVGGLTAVTVSSKSGMRSIAPGIFVFDEQSVSKPIELV